MLRAASVALAQRSTSFAAVARTRASLEALASQVAAQRARYVALDWGEPDRFISGLARLVEEFERPTQVLAWLHESRSITMIAAVLWTPHRECNLYHVMGSASARPADGLPLREEVDKMPGVAYFQIVLGYKRDFGVPRWLTDAEISQGVLEAVACRQPLHVVGLIEPWEQRP